jgi:hypothetical protein
MKIIAKNQGRCKKSQRKVYAKFASPEIIRECTCAISRNPNALSLQVVASN